MDTKKLSFPAAVILGLVISTLGLTPTGPSYVRVELFENGNCGGWKHTADLDRMCYYFPNLENDISGVRVPIGSCAKIKGTRSCEGNTFTIKYPNWEYCELPCCGWNDNIKSINDCNTRTRKIECPEGTYVREISRGEANQGATIVCYEPTSSQARSTLNTHGITIPSPTTERCPIAAFGINAGWSDDWQMFHDISPLCNRKVGGPLPPRTKNFSQVAEHIQKPKLNPNVTGKRMGKIQAFSNQCSAEFPALVRLEVVLDEADVMKELFYLCHEVPNPAEMCEPLEALSTVITCDNSQSGNEMECEYSRKIGVALSSTLTETERREYQWSMEVGYEIGASIGGLSASMSATLGHSELVGYEWSTSDTATWSEEITVSALIRVKPYTLSVLEQLTGKCTFYGVQVNYFRQVDKEVNGTTTVTYFTV